MLWNIHTWRGGKNTGYFVDVTPGVTTVRGVKYELSALTNIPVAQQRIVWMGRELGDSVVLTREIASEMARLVFLPGNVQAPAPGCAMCSEPASKRCGRCQKALYCSAECQSSDWSQHSDACYNGTSA